MTQEQKIIKNKADTSQLIYTSEEFERDLFCCIENHFNREDDILQMKMSLHDILVTILQKCKTA